MSSLANEQMVREAVETGWLGRDYRYWVEIDSTNEWIKANRADLSHGTAVLTDFQTAGKGRMQRKWAAPSGSSLLVSFLLRPNWPAADASWVTMIAALAARDAAIAVGGNFAPAAFKFKWPNDLMIEQPDGEAFKTGGILVESSISGDQLVESIVGIGINVNLDPAQLGDTRLPATSLQSAAGKAVDRLQLFAALCAAFERRYDAVTAGDTPHIAWEQHLLTLGKPVIVRYRDDETVLTGIAVGVDRYGCLLVCDDAGRSHTVAAGDVTLRASD